MQIPSHWLIPCSFSFFLVFIKLLTYAFSINERIIDDIIITLIPAYLCAPCMSSSSTVLPGWNLVPRIRALLQTMDRIRGSDSAVYRCDNNWESARKRRDVGRRSIRWVAGRNWQVLLLIVIGVLPESFSKLICTSRNEYLQRSELFGFPRPFWFSIPNQPLCKQLQDCQEY